MEAKNGGDIGLNGSAKESNHSNTSTMHEASGDIGLTKAAKESNHSGGYTSTMISALVRWTRPTDQKPSGDIGLNGSAKGSTTVARPTNER